MPFTPPLRRTALRRTRLRFSRPLLALALLSTGCAFVEYEAEPLCPEDDARALAERAAAGLAPGDGPLTLTRAAELLRERSPRVREAIAAYRTAAATASIETPWPDPTLSLGPLVGVGPALDTGRAVGFVQLSAQIPLGGRLARQDDVNAAVANAALADTLALWRTEVLELRRGYVALAVARRGVELRERVAEAARDSLGFAQRLVDAGGATALDVALFRLEGARESSRVVGARRTEALAAGDLAAQLAVPARNLGALPEDALPTVPGELPALEDLQTLVIEENPTLLALRAAYEVTERQLHLEVARQVPDLLLGPQISGQNNEEFTTVGLAVGLQLPVFDRNRVAIARADAARTEARERYFAAVDDAFGAVERARANLELVRELGAVLTNDVLPAAEDSREIARLSLEAGATGGLSVLDAERSLRAVQVEALEARYAELMAWIELEGAIGYPLVRFDAAPPSAPVPVFELDGTVVTRDDVNPGVDE